MGFIFTLLATSVILGILIGLLNDGDKKFDLRPAFNFTLVCVAISATLCGIIMIFSYFNYVGMMQYKAEIESARVGAIELYVKHADAPSGAKGGQVISDNTDHKYENFQRYLDCQIRHLRYAVEEYNSRLTGKRIYKSMWYWSALISLPEDPGPIKIGY